MDGNGAIAQHRLGPGRGDRDIIALLAEGNVSVLILLDIFIGLAILQRIFEMPEMAVDLFIFHFQIGDGGFEMRIPINETLIAIDQPFIVKLNENAQDRIGKALIHGEAFARPVAGCAKPLELADDRAARFFLPLPDALDKSFAAHCAAVRLLPFHELALDHHLRGDAGMIGARLPEHILTAHALIADENILKRIVKRMAHMERASHIGRRDHNAKTVGGLFAALFDRSGLECAGLFPLPVDFALNRGRLVVFLKHRMEFQVRMAAWAALKRAAAGQSRHVESFPE